MASQMPTPIFDELLREMTAAAEAPQAPQPEPQPEPQTAGGRRRKPE